MAMVMTMLAKMMAVSISIIIISTLTGKPVFHNMF